MIKQYTVDKIYLDADILGDYLICKYIDGKLIEQQTISFLNIEKTCELCEEEGYIRAYDVSVALDRLNLIQEEQQIIQQEYQKALEYYNTAKDNPLFGSV